MPVSDERDGCGGKSGNLGVGKESERGSGISCADGTGGGGIER